MQVVQLLPAIRRPARAAWPRSPRPSAPGGRFAAAIVEGLPPSPNRRRRRSPTCASVDGWVYSSLPVDAAVEAGEIVDPAPAPDGLPCRRAERGANEVRIHTFSADQLEAEAAAAGLVPLARSEIPPTDLHVGSTVVVLEKEA